MNADKLKSQLKERFRIITIDGPIGVGKTTLLNRAGDLLGINTVQDNIGKNPLLSEFYKNIEKNAFATQVQFIVNRHRLWKEIENFAKDAPVMVDFIPEREVIFAENNLSNSDKMIFLDLFRTLFASRQQADAIIYLTADTDVLIERIAGRGISFEGRITRKYLQNISDKFHKFFFTLEGKPVLVVNTNNYDIIESEESVFDIFYQLLHTRNELQYYTPPSIRG